MTRAVSVLVFFVGGSLLSCIGTHVHAGPDDQVGTNAPESPRVVRYRSDHFRDPFVPKSVVLNPASSSVEVQGVGRQTVKVMGTMSSAKGRVAMLEFEDGERLIVVPGQVISAHSRIVKRITEQGVILSATGDKEGTQVENTYRLYEERDYGEPRSGGIPENPEQ